MSSLFYKVLLRICIGIYYVYTWAYMACEWVADKATAIFFKGKF